MSSFFGINVVLSALKASQYAMDVTGHNIANANTEGYRRQEAIFTANSPNVGSFGSGATLTQLGTGVTVSEIRRTQTNFLDSQVRIENQLCGMWTAKNQALQQVESLLSEPGDNGISAALGRFWNSWQNLATSPESAAARTDVVSSATSLSDGIRNLYENLRSLQTDLDRNVADSASEINALVQEIASINNQTVEGRSGDYQPNDLIDKRDMLVEKLSRLLRIEVHGSGGSNMIISVGGKVLVQGNYSATVDVALGSNGRTKLVWGDDGTDVAVTGGELKGFMDTRDSLAEGYVQSLDRIAQAIVSRVNAIHATGFDKNGNPGGDFFTAGSGAGNISVDAAILASPSLVAASSVAGESGNNEIANAITNIRTDLLVDNQTIGDSYAGLVAKIGSDARESSVHNEAHEYSLNNRKTQRDSVAGVSIDEEMTNMIRFQQAYNAAARIFTVMDEMLATIINSV